MWSVIDCLCSGGGFPLLQGISRVLAWTFPWTRENGVPAAPGPRRAPFEPLKEIAGGPARIPATPTRTARPIWSHSSLGPPKRSRGACRTSPSADPTKRSPKASPDPPKGPTEWSPSPPSSIPSRAGEGQLKRSADQFQAPRFPHSGAYQQILSGPAQTSHGPRETASELPRRRHRPGSWPGSSWWGDGRPDVLGCRRTWKLREAGPQRGLPGSVSLLGRPGRWTLGHAVARSPASCPVCPVPT